MWDKAMDYVKNLASISAIGDSASRNGNVVKSCSWNPPLAVFFKLNVNDAVTISMDKYGTGGGV